MTDGFPQPSASKAGNLIVNPGSSTPGALETYMREWRWWTESIAFLQGFPALRDGFEDNAVVPGVDGRTAFASKIDQGTYVTGLRVTGVAGASGVAPSGTAEYRFLRQLRRNMDYLWTNVGTPPSGATRSARIVWDDGTTVNFSAQFRLTRVSQKGAEAGLMLDVVVPAGRP
jgi:hypothetical protein